MEKSSKPHPFSDVTPYEEILNYISMLFNDKAFYGFTIVGGIVALWMMAQKMNAGDLKGGGWNFAWLIAIMAFIFHADQSNANYKVVLMDKRVDKNVITNARSNAQFDGIPMFLAATASFASAITFRWRYCS